VAQPAFMASQPSPPLSYTVRTTATNFGVVTDFRFRLHPLGPQVTDGNHPHDLSGQREGPVGR
jgi:hypothetical protein